MLHFNSAKKRPDPVQHQKPPARKVPCGGRRSAAAYSPALWAVPSARPGLTSLFGMGRGGAPGLWPPEWGTRWRNAKGSGRGIQPRQREGRGAEGAPPAGAGPRGLRRKLRAISRARLWRRRLCTCPLSTSSSRTALMRKSDLAAGFALRCLQRLSDPDLATRPCAWRHNRLTRGRSGTVLSY